MNTLITRDTSRLVLEGLFTTVTNVNFNNDTITELIRRVEKERETPGALIVSCARSPAAKITIMMNNLGGRRGCPFSEIADFVWNPRRYWRMLTAVRSGIYR